MLDDACLNYFFSKILDAGLDLCAADISTQVVSGDLDMKNMFIKTEVLHFSSYVGFLYLDIRDVSRRGEGAKNCITTETIFLVQQIAV